MTDSFKPYYERHVFFCCNQRDDTTSFLQRQGRLRDARLRQEARQGARPRRRGQGPRQPGRLPRPLRGRSRASWSIPKRSGTPTSIAPTSTKSSRSTSGTAGSSSACGSDARVHAARTDRRSGGPHRVRGRCARRSSRRRADRAPASRCSAARSTTRSCRRSRAVLSSWATRRAPQFPRRRRKRRRARRRTRRSRGHGRGARLAQAQFGDAPPVLAGFSFGSFVQTHLAQLGGPGTHGARRRGGKALRRACRSRRTPW